VPGRENCRAYTPLVYFTYTLQDYLHGFDDRAHLQDIRGLLGKMLFKGEEGLKPTHALSDEEKVSGVDAA
jgi:ATPase subunit of ABC transporter with duplicated ATPase domains